MIRKTNKVYSDIIKIDNMVIDKHVVLLIGLWEKGIQMYKRTNIRKLEIFILFIMLTVTACNSGDPEQTVQIINTGSYKCSLTMQLYSMENVLSDKYTVNKTVKPHNEVYIQISEGLYLISIWDDNDKLLKEFDKILITLPSGESSYNPIVIDTALNKNYALVNLNYLYSGGAFAEHMSKAVGTNSDKLKVISYYKGDVPFFVPEEYRTSITFVDVFTDKIPKEIVYGNTVYGLIPIPSGITTKNDIGDYIERYLEKKM